MKTFIIAALMAGLTTGPVLAAPYHGPNDRGRVERTQRTVVKQVVVRHDNRRDHRSWTRGQRFDSRYAPNYRVISSPRVYHLNDAPRGYRWVRSGNDAVLVGIASGIVAAVMANMIR
jgi:Ni/Co efflux regulator RcnB